ncbi:MAG: hypothetical protein H0V17_36225 [Deltaproteobacteria bacterium]|nr:hypothetical protein [Deltaproteobacteria bacterium]
MLRPLVTVLLASTLGGCMVGSYSPGVVYYVPVVPMVPLAAFPPAPFHHYPPPAPAVAEFQTPSLTVRALAMKISESASTGDCGAAITAGDELEQIDNHSHHALLAVDERYAGCVRGF